ncbi:MAG: tetratricopeptide repeat-containing glycosyltransferase family protein [Planctomycetaceae bacterium]
MSVKRRLKSVALRLPLPILCNPLTAAVLRLFPGSVGEKARGAASVAVFRRTQRYLSRGDVADPSGYYRWLRRGGVVGQRTLTALRATLLKAGRHEEAIALCRMAIQDDPNDYGAAFDLVHWMELQGESAEGEALRSYREIMRAVALHHGFEGENPSDRKTSGRDAGQALDWQHAEVLSKLSRRLSALGDREAAHTCYRWVIRLHSGRPKDLFNLASISHSQGDVESALRYCRDAGLLAVKNKAFQLKLAAFLGKKVCSHEAIVCYQRVLDVDPRNEEALCGLTDLSRFQDNLDEALTCCLWGIRLRPDSAPLHNALGVCLGELGRYEESIAAFERALSFDPQENVYRFNKTYPLLALGRFADAWKSYGVRGERLGMEVRSPPRLRLNAGTPIKGQRLLVLGTSGIGDEVRFASCYPDAIEQAAAATLVCDPRLQSLFERSFPDAEVFGYRRQYASEAPVIRTNGSCDLGPIDEELLSRVPEFDTCCLGGDLPFHVRPTRESFGRSPSYLRACPFRRTFWRNRLKPVGPGLKVGIAWRSGVMWPQRIREYTRLADWAEILSIPGVHFVNLQYDAEEEILAAERESGVTIHRWEDLDLKDDLEGIAALTSELDLVISAPTLVVELAGALGVPAWRLVASNNISNYWRVRPRTNKDLWHPAMTMFAAPGDHAELLRKVAESLRDRAGVDRAKLSLAAG